MDQSKFVFQHFLESGVIHIPILGYVSYPSLYSDIYVPGQMLYHHYNRLFVVLPSSAQAPASQSPAGGLDSLIFITVGNHHTAYSIHPEQQFLPVSLTTYSRLVCDQLIICSRLFLNLFITCSLLVHYLFITSSQLVHTLFVTCS